jgi:hydrogenase maturation protein HypF
MVKGVVQGVGFRPFVHGLAQSYDLKGFVLNSSEGVLIEVESSEPEALDEFGKKLQKNLPPLAKIEEITIENLEPCGHKEFTILKSRSERGHFTFISPDIATCRDCLTEIQTPGDRRFQYPFTNCTNCGPRYTIISDIPYDRPKTTMAKFRMCPDCRAEYNDPSNRRFHAQPNACPQCGPSVTLHLSEVSGILENRRSHQEPLACARGLLAQGHIMAIKGVGGFHIACNAFDEEAVQRLRRNKRRSNKPFALMCRDLATIEQFCKVTDVEIKLLQTHRKPILLLPKRKTSKTLSEAIAPGNRYLGVMLPYTPLHYMLFDERLSVLVMTSGNLSEEPIVIENREALERLSDLADHFLFHDRAIHTRVDDSVTRILSGKEQVVRRARGYAPSPIDLGRDFPQVLACGAELKNTLCLIKGRYGILSQHIGDMENLESFEFFRETLEKIKALYRIRPTVVAHDLHPRYLSTQFALEIEDLPKIGVQHHHAHIVSCMAENHIWEPVIGVAFDGTGYSEDATIWGGEILITDPARYRRVGHLRALPLPGGEPAIRNPWRMALSALYSAFGPEFRRLPLEFVDRHRGVQMDLICRMLEKETYCPLTTSAGRLFDAISSLIGLCDRVTFEAEAAIRLEMAADPSVDDPYLIPLHEERCLILDPLPTVEQIVEDLNKGVANRIISMRFHLGIAEAVVQACKRIRKKEALSKVCLSGGVFQNKLLLERLVQRLEETKFQVYLHGEVPCNDGGISLGQAVVAGFRTQ